jgi:excisionase family DNA binding protein
MNRSRQQTCSASTDPYLLTVEAAAQRLSLSRAQLYVLLRRKDLESVRIGTSRRIPSQSLLAYIERLRVEAQHA